MVPIKAKDIQEASGARLLSGDPESLVSSISADSRCLHEGDLFIPLKGLNFNAHEFIDQAMADGAVGFLTEQNSGDVKTWLRGTNLVFLVGDTRQALNSIAHLVRRRLRAKVVGISGSTGKTSTKDILSSITNKTFNLTASAKNNNNEIGVPMTITKAKLETELLIVEMGMRGVGQIASLAAITEPDIGIITNIGQAHIGLLGSEEKIARAKAELIEALPADGYAILNADDEWLDYLRERTKAKVVTFGLSSNADYRAVEISYDDMASPSWRLVVNGSEGPIFKLPVPGRHNIINALAAIAAAKIIGVDDRAIADGLSQVELGDMRLKIVRSGLGFIIVNDAYNANPSSMAEALETVAKIKTDTNRYAVLGAMAELGEDSIAAHKEVGRKIASVGIDRLAAVGRETEDIAKSAVQSGLPEQDVKWFQSKDDVARWLLTRLVPGDVVLVKGSRVAGLESVVEELSKERE